MNSVMNSSTHPTPLAAVEATGPSPGYSLGIEIDESSWFVATTFRHIEGTPTTLPDVAEMVAALARWYGDAS